MNNLFQTDHSRVLLYLDENAGWLKVLTTQADEIPVLEKILYEKENTIENKVAEKEHFKNLLHQQHEQMKELNNELDKQQQRLTVDAAGESLYDIESLCSQDILRNRIKDVEQRYIDLKCSFMRFLSDVI
ncbi:MAG: hypothetical protein IPP72_08940 [Chitinophagaceae bacterium]|nr:hypothetical protein [Chitinophagaceae bacterium]